MAFQQHNRIKVGKAIYGRIPFEHASMSGKWITSEEFRYASYGQLPQEDVSTLRSLLSEHGKLYLVYSYRTPIAYALPHSNDIRIFDHKYSVTTTHHQSIVRLADHYALNY